MSVFNFDTFTKAIYKAWFGLFSLPTAAQHASLLLLLAEQGLRCRARFHDTAQATPPSQPHHRGLRAGIALAAASFVFLAGFALPLVHSSAGW